MAKIQTYPLDSTPSFSDMLVGTDVNGPILNATKNFSLQKLYDLFATVPITGTLQTVLNAGNTATQNIFLTGNIQSTTIKPQYIVDENSSTGTLSQILRRTATGIQWVNLAANNLQAVLDAGNTATQNIILTGTIQSTISKPQNISDVNSSIGTLGQVLKKGASGIVWQQQSIPTLDLVLEAGNISSRDAYVGTLGLYDGANDAFGTMLLSDSVFVLRDAFDNPMIAAEADTFTLNNKTNILSSLLTTSRYFSFPNKSGTIALTSDIPAASPLTTKGDLYTFSTTNARLPVGLDTQVLIADSTQSTGLKWGSNTSVTPLGYYGAFSDVTNQVAAAINTGYPMRFAVDDIPPNGVSIVANGSGQKTRITFAQTGIYNLQWSAQFVSTDNAECDISVWLRKNEVDVAGSRGLVAVPKKIGLVNGHALPSWNFVLSVTAGEYYEFVWSTANLNASIQALPATVYAPSTASTILTVTQQAGIIGGTDTLFKSASNTFQTTAGSILVSSTAISSAFFQNGTLLKINTAVATTAASTALIEILYFINTTNTLTGATQIGRYSGPIGNRYIPMDRTFWTFNNAFFCRDFTASASTSTSNSTFGINSVAIPPTNFYILAQVTTTGSDRACLCSVSIEKT